MKKNVEKYSVLMSVYGKENPDFLRQSMESIYEQTVPTDDFVLVCDGALNEGLDAVIDEMQEKFGKRLRVVRFLKNRGLGAALHDGVLECRNELIARMDSDDVAVPERCERELGVFRESDVDVVGSNIAEYDENMRECISNRLVPEKHDEIATRLKKRNPMNHQTVMFKKEKVMKAGNYQDMKGFEDYFLWARMIKGGCKFYNVSIPLVKVRGGADMTKRRGGVEYVKSNIKFQKELAKLGVISAPRAGMNMLERTIVAMMPNGLRARFYSKLLRDSSHER